MNSASKSTQKWSDAQLARRTIMEAIGKEIPGAVVRMPTSGNALIVVYSRHPQQPHQITWNNYPKGDSMVFKVFSHHDIFTAEAMKAKVVLDIVGRQQLIETMREIVTNFPLLESSEVIRCLTEQEGTEWVETLAKIAFAQDDGLSPPDEVAANILADIRQYCKDKGVNFEEVLKDSEDLVYDDPADEAGVSGEQHFGGFDDDDLGRPEPHLDDGEAHDSHDHLNDTSALSPSAYRDPGDDDEEAEGWDGSNRHNDPDGPDAAYGFSDG